jgi:hypothetical protein
MAAVRVTLTLQSPDVLSSTLSIAVDSTVVVDSGSLIRAKVKGTAADTDDFVVYKANDKLENAYLYVKNMDAKKENYVYLRNETESDTALSAKIGGGEFAFLPIPPDKTVAVFATKIDTLVEYGVFGYDNSSVSISGSGT